MAGVAEENEAQRSTVKGIFRVGRCLRGLIDGNAVFRFANETAKRITTPARPRKEWFQDGWFSRNLLDE